MPDEWFEKYEGLRFERREHGVLWMTIDRPESLNATTASMHHALSRVWDDIDDDPDTRVIVLAGRGKSFCAGADLNWMKRMVGYSEEENLRDSALLQTMLDTINRCPKPVIASVHGAVLGGGTGLISTCDSVVATPTALFGRIESSP